jgi:hypothetical protein
MNIFPASLRKELPRPDVEDNDCGYTSRYEVSCIDCTSNTATTALIKIDKSTSCPQTKEMEF